MTLCPVFLSMIGLTAARVLTSAPDTPRLTITQQPLPLSSAPASLTCSAASDSLPDIAWYRDGVLVPGRILQNSALLHLNLSKGTDNARSRRGSPGLGEMVSTLEVRCSSRIHVYTCVASAGDTLLPSAEAVVLPQDDRADCDEASAREEVTKWFSNVMIEQGRRVELVCGHVVNSKSGHVTWSRDYQVKIIRH